MQMQARPAAAGHDISWELKRKTTCLDEAVMEGEADEAGADAGFRRMALPTTFRTMNSAGGHRRL